MSNKTKIKGFTLIELMVAIAIFAVLAALGWKIFDYLSKVKDRNAMHEQNLDQLQQAYQQIQRDTLQTIPVTGSVGQQILPALQLENQKMSFSKTGMTDPLKQGIASFERIEYVYNVQDKKLYRLKYSNLNLSAAAQPLSSVLLSDVDQYQISVLNPNEGDRWPDENAFNERQLPRGIKIKVMIHDVEYEWIFSLLNTEFLREQNNRNNSP
ncbi:type II secretion system protein GspJ [Acinetobacter defluvii]|uniref:type II secretion system minor pseudopilin GspJ n=1 Tax=Acinetobacter defluvii TaxID=1871111 RepID=UPI00148F564B|nr:type II secretion system minor pseudopilin GspJ [Acinetobacter defluvii]NNP73589.1 type II secretion system protein GspJ [Acinetobacter defluvii]